MATAPPGMPDPLRAALDAPATDRRPWAAEIAPAYINLFLLPAYYDQLAPHTLAVGGLGWSVLGAAAAGLLCLGLLYYAPALWGQRARQPLAVVATSTFGASGATWVPGLLVAVVQVAWFAVAITLAADIVLRALVACRLLAPGALMHPVGPAELGRQSAVFLIVTFVWALACGLIGIWVVRLVAAVMKAYAPFVALALGATMLWALPGLGAFRPPGVGQVAPGSVGPAGPLAALMMIQLVFGFFASAGAGSADWGAVARGVRDVRLAGLVGVALAALILATVPLLTVAGVHGRAAASAQGRELGARPPAVAGSVDVGPKKAPSVGGDDFAYRVVLQDGIGGYPGGALMMVLSLALLGPTCYTPYVFGHRFAAAWPGVPRWLWSWLGTMAAWPLIATGAPIHLDRMFGLLGAAMAPVVGALAADSLRNRGAWPGPRRGSNPAGVLAWALGLAVGLLPELGAALDSPGLRRLQPASVLAFAAAFLAYTLLARFGLEPPPLVASGAAPSPVVDEPKADAGQPAPGSEASAEGER